MEQSEIQVAERTLFGVSDEAPVMDSHVATTGQDERVIASVVCVTRAATEQREGVVENTTVSFAN